MLKKIKRDGNVIMSGMSKCMGTYCVGNVFVGQFFSGEELLLEQEWVVV